MLLGNRNMRMRTSPHKRSEIISPSTNALNRSEAVELGGLPAQLFIVVPAASAKLLYHPLANSGILRSFPLNESLQCCLPVTKTVNKIL